MTHTWTQVSEERHWYMLEVLPPALMTGAGFLVGEPWTHDEHDRPMFQAHVQIGDRYYEALEPMTAADFRKITRADVLGHLAPGPVCGNEAPHAPHDHGPHYGRPRCPGRYAAEVSA